MAALLNLPLGESWSDPIDVARVERGRAGDGQGARARKGLAVVGNRAPCALFQFLRFVV